MSNNNLKLDFADAVRALGVTGVYFIIEGMCNKDTDADFEAFKNETINNALSDLSLQKIETDKILAGFRLLHDRVNASNRKNVASPENLLSFLLQRRQIPHISLLVDIYNLVSIKSKLALGAHDISHISGNIHLRITDGTEKFVPLGSDKQKPVGKGEYSYVDDSNEVICRLETRQVEKTKVKLDTTDCFYIVQGNASTDVAYLRNASDELIALTKRFCGGKERFLYVPW